MFNMTEMMIAICCIEDLLKQNRECLTEVETSCSLPSKEYLVLAGLLDHMSRMSNREMYKHERGDRGMEKSPKDSNLTAGTFTLMRSHGKCRSHTK